MRQSDTETTVSFKLLRCVKMQSECIRTRACFICFFEVHRFLRILEAFLHRAWEEYFLRTKNIDTDFQTLPSKDIIHLHTFLDTLRSCLNTLILGRYACIFLRCMCVFPRYIFVFQRYACIFPDYISIFRRCACIFLRCISVFRRYACVFSPYISLFRRC